MAIIGIGNRIREVRQMRGLSQKELAEKLNVSVQAVSQWENNRSGISTEKVIALAEATNADPGWLINGARTKTVFNEFQGEVSRVPVIDLGDVVLFRPANAFGKAPKSPFEILTDVSFVGGAFAVYMFEDIYSPKFEVGDLLIFDSALECRDGDVVIASIIESDGSAKPRDHKRSIVTQLWATETLKSDPSLFDVKSLTQSQPPQSALNNFLFHGTLVERRTYPRITPQEIENLRSCFGPQSVS